MGFVVRVSWSDGPDTLRNYKVAKFYTGFSKCQVRLTRKLHLPSLYQNLLKRPYVLVFLGCKRELQQKLLEWGSSHIRAICR